MRISDWSSDVCSSDLMPSPYTSRSSLDDAADVAEALGITCDTISIGPAMEAFGMMFAGVFEGRDADTTEENIQARARGLTLMAMSNKFGAMVLSTGNKSELSRSEERRVGKECGSKCRYRGSPTH